MTLADIKFPGLEQLVSTMLKWVAKDRRKVLPYSEVRVGTYLGDRLKVDVMAAIVLSDPLQPDVNIFVERLVIRKPCCAACERPLNVRTASWMADFAQIGYACPACQTEISKYASDLRNDVIAEI